MAVPGEQRPAERWRAERPWGRNRLNAAEGVVTCLRAHQCIDSTIGGMYGKQGALERAPGQAAAERPSGQGPKLREAVEAGTGL